MKKNLIGGLVLSGGIITSALVSTVLMSSLLLSGCQLTGSTAEKSAITQAETVSFEQTNWQLQEIAGNTVSLHPQQKPIALTFSGAEQGVAGFSGCNRFSGGYKAEDGKLEFLPLMSTRMACHGDDQREMTFFMTLDKVKSYRVTGKQLTFLDVDNKVIMVFIAS